MKYLIADSLVSRGSFTPGPSSTGVERDVAKQVPQAGLDARKNFPAYVEVRPDSLDAEERTDYDQRPSG
jgi:hypothetical protein